MKTKVLVVEDCPDNLRFLAQIISADQVEIHFAQSEDDALRLLLSHKFALALIRMQMPMMGGAELVRLLRNFKTDHYVPVMLVDLNEKSSLDYFDVYSAGVVDLVRRPLDIHALKNKIDVFIRLDQQRLQAEEHEQNLSVMRDHFIAVVSHELRAPLGSVIGFAELLRNEDMDDSDRKRISESILRNGEMLLRLVDDILDYSRIESGKLTLNPKKIELRDFLTKIQTDLKMIAEEKNISLLVDLPEKDFTIHGDPIRIRQMLYNLLGNALKFTERGFVRMSLNVDGLDGEQGPRSRITFRIEDTGIGITDESRLFKPFGQDISLGRTSRGTGLGLVISRQLARMMGGDVLLISTEPGAGSVFEVSITTQGYAPRPLEHSFSL